MDKQALRERVWSRLERTGVTRFPKPVRGRIPNFVGAERCAARLGEVPAWRRARTLKCNPDAPQLPVRRRALREGKVVYMAVPRLRTEKCFLRLDPAALGKRAAQAASIRGASQFGAPVVPQDLEPIDLVVAGSVAVNRRGQRVGKGGGYSDLEFALARELGKVGAQTPVLTTVHALQVVAEAIPMTPHDVPLDVVVTPERVVRVARPPPKPRGIAWDELGEAQLAAMPALARLRGARRR